MTRRDWLLACLALAPGAGCKSTESGTAPPGVPASTSSRPDVAVSAPLATAAPSASTAPLASSAPPAATKRAYSIAALGDSLTDEKSFGGGFLGYVQERCPETRIDNFGKGALMLNQIRRRFEDSVHNQPAGTYTHVIIWGGVNDLYSDLTAGRTPEKAEADLSVMYEKARNKGAKVVAITISPWGGFKRYYNERRQGYTDAVNAWIKQQFVERNIDAVVDAYALLSCGDPTLLCPDYAQLHSDGLHLGPKGHEVLGKALYDAVFSDCR